MPALNFPDSPAENATYTNSETGVVYVYKNGAWRTASNETNLDDVYVQVSGDKMTGDLTLGPEGDTNITLNATNGSADFIGSFQHSTFNNNDAEGYGVQNEFGGMVLIQRAASFGDLSALKIYQGDTDTVDINCNGSASFDGRIDCAGIAADGNSRIYNKVTNPAASLFTCNSDVGGTNEGKFTVLAGGNTTVTGTITTPGVIFGTPAGNATSKTLDDYEEGTFTPAWTGNGAAIGAGQYIRIGKTVHTWANITFPGTSNTELQVLIGWPFSIANGRAAGWSVSADAAFPHGFTFVPGSSTALYVRNGADQSQNLARNVTASNSCNLYLTYITD